MCRAIPAYLPAFEELNTGYYKTLDGDCLPLFHPIVLPTIGMMHSRDRGSLNPSPKVQHESIRPSRHMISAKPSVEDYFKGSSSKLLPAPSGTPKPKPTGQPVRRGLNNDESTPYSKRTRSKPRSISSKNTFHWIKGDLIGKGSHGKVYLAFNASTGEIMAVKQVEVPATASDRSKPSLTNLVEALRSERDTLRDLDHENVVQYLGFEENPKTINIFLQYVSGGSIGACLRKTGRFREEVTKDFTRQILQGLAYLHSKGIVHRDMKADNLLVEDSGVCKISDFGISKKLEEMSRAHTHMKGTSYWMAPEVFSRGPNGYDTKVDIWSLGCVVFEMWTAKRPWFDQVDILTVMFKLMDSKTIPPLPEDLQLSQFAEHFRLECFNYDPEKRPTAEFLLKHPYLDLPPEWNFPGVSDMSEPVPPSPTEDAAHIIQNTAHLRVAAPSYRRSASPALTMNSTTLGSSLDAPVVLPPRPKSPPLVIIPPPPPRKLPSPERAVDWVVRARSSSVTSESSTSQKSSQQSATTRSKRLVIHNPDTVPDLTKSQKRSLPETPKAPPFVYSPPPLPDTRGPVPYSQQLAPLPRNRFADLASSSKSGNSSSRNARVQQYVSAASLSTPSLPNRFGPANMQEVMASRSDTQEAESEDGSDYDSSVASSMWQIPPRKRLSLPASPLDSVTPTQRQRGHKRVSSVIKDSRPNGEEVLKNLEVYFPRHDLHEPVVESPVESRFFQSQSANNRPALVLKSIKTIAEEQIHKGISSPDRRRQTRLWDSRTEEIKAPR